MKEKKTFISERKEDFQEMDDTELRKYVTELEKKISDIKRKYHGLFELTNDALFIISLDGHYLEVNQQAADLLGYSKDDLIGRSAYNFISPIDQDKAQQKHRYLLAGEVIPIYERSFRKKDGTDFIAEINASLIYDDNGKPLYIQSAIRDISERKKFEESIMDQAALILESKKEIQKSEEEKISILNAMQEHVIYYEEGTEIKWANKAAADSLNKLPHELIGKHCHRLWADSGKICEGCPVVMARKSLKPQSNEMITPDGRIWLVRGLPILEDGELKAVVEITNEITEIKKTQEKIRKMNIELEERVKERTAQLKATNEELKAFSYSVSHDLRAPIRRIKSFTQLIKNRCEELIEQDRKLADYLEMVLNSTDEMNNYVEGMMKLSRINQMKLVKKEINSFQLIQEIIRENKNEYLNREIKWKVDEELPLIYGDPTLLRVAFTNVILNSIKFTDNEKEPFIEIGFDQKQSDDSSKVLYIKDNGIGFDMKYASKLFTVFQRLHLNRDYPGTGIGLATVQRIIHRHDGKVWADSKENHGTVIFFELPTKKK